MISVVIPTYNRERVLANTLDSIAAQTYKEWECIIVDDASTDRSMDVAAEYTKKDSRFKVLRNVRQKGAQGARNMGILAAEGEWICLFDSDDLMYPDYMQEMTDAIEEGVDIVVCKALIRNSKTGKEEGQLDSIFADDYHVDLLAGRCYIPNDVTLIRKEKLLAVRLLDEQCPSLQELETHIRLSKIAKYKAIDKVLCEWNTGEMDTISVNTEKHIAGQLYIMRKHRWAYRRNAYTSFLVRARNIWEDVTEMHAKSKYKMTLLCIVPELSIVLLKRRLFKK